MGERMARSKAWFAYKTQLPCAWIHGKLMRNRFANKQNSFNEEIYTQNRFGLRIHIQWMRKTARTRWLIPHPSSECLNGNTTYLFLQPNMSPQSHQKCENKHWINERYCLFSKCICFRIRNRFAYTARGEVDNMLSRWSNHSLKF